MWPALTAPGSGRERLEQALAGYCEAVEANLELAGRAGRGRPQRDLSRGGPARPDPPGLHRADPPAAAGRRRRRLAGRRGSGRDRHPAAEPRQLDLSPPAPRPRLGRRARPRRRAAHRAGRSGRAVSSGLDRRGLAVLASGHACADMAQGAIPALLPFLIDQRGISYGAAGALILVTSVGSSAIQPLFGLGSDRLSLPWLMPLGVLLAGLGVALVGVTSSYPATAAAVALSGLGVASFHPEGARFANQVSGDSARAGDELLLPGRQRRLRARAHPRDAARADLRPARDAPAGRHPDDRGRRPRARPCPAAGGRRREVRALRAQPRRRGSRRGRLERVRAPGRRRRAALVRLLRPSGLHPAVVHPPARHRRGGGQRGADRDARGRRRRDLLGWARRRPRRAPAPGGRVDRPHHPGPRRARARAHPADGGRAHRRWRASSSSSPSRSPSS